ncbi:cation diffusion facilitator family transporter [bacterium]|nr:cation diffusion facilitator family transporter [bacterium]
MTSKRSDEHDHNHDHNDEHDHDRHDHKVGHDHNDHKGGHTHGTVDPSLFDTKRGIRAVQWSSLGMFLTACIQAIIVWYSGSVALFADTIHNFGDAGTAIPLLIAFSLAKLPATKRFTYGYGRAEDLAGLVIVGLILFSAIVAAYESISRFFHPQKIEHLYIVMIASVVGFIGNELAARFRIKVGKEIGSAALIADGHHARIDGFTSLSVLLSSIGVKLGYPIADPIVGLIITVMILRILWESSKSIFSRLLDGIDPEIVDEIRESAKKINQVLEVTDVRVRWIGHRMHGELNVAVDAQLSVEHAHDIAKEVHHQLMHDLTYLTNATIHIDPVDASGEDHHRVAAHEHGEFSSHSH